MASVPWQLGLPGEIHIHHGLRARTAQGIADADAAVRREDRHRRLPASPSSGETQ